MNKLISSLNYNDAILITAPPGWGKTYKLLHAIQKTKRKTVFIFPLRALCDEVHLSAVSKNIRVLNLRSMEDYQSLSSVSYELVVVTPELFKFCDELSDFLFVIDEFHLFYYWGDTFRERMQEMYMELTSYSVPVMFLTATLGESQYKRLRTELALNYENIYHLNMGNQTLMNLPRKVFYYPRFFRKWLDEDYCFAAKRGTSLIFCQYRDEVKEIASHLKNHGHTVLSCVGGEAAMFIQQLNSLKKVDFIVATSVVSHGVNLPKIRNIYFTYNVQNLDFYLQMLGRGGRAGEGFNVHVLSTQYFSKKTIVMGFLGILTKRLGNKINSYIYYLYAH
ncbi:MAG: DEAD/DEAH box helicase [Halobacteriovoraceae bacterium]|jgi:ATP-dependent DNA helicase RecQ|nr:DEAD/DEAH box helicase [Halobacteriovoraceae bacterium]